MKKESWEVLVGRQVRLFEQRSRGATEQQDRPDMFVTISRQFGCGGFSLANALAERLNQAVPEKEPHWIAYDRRLILDVAQQEKLSKDLFESLDERLRGQVSDYLESLICGWPDQESIFRKIVRTMVTLAMHGRAILVGRGGAIVTRHLPGGHHYRLVAPRQHRISQIAAELGVGQDEAEQRVDKGDRVRRRLIKEFLTEDVSDSCHYDAVLNTARITQQEMVELIAGRLARVRNNG
ncbi:MAG: cytidylate kinase-like family protein [Deltaproteobacteria bacterium]|nr:cytidylate kinase-like family protein [Deltaproteobacteria bacterium]